MAGRCPSPSGLSRRIETGLLLFVLLLPRDLQGSLALFKRALQSLASLTESPAWLGPPTTRQTPWYSSASYRRSRGGRYDGDIATPVQICPAACAGKTLDGIVGAVELVTRESREIPEIRTPPSRPMFALWFSKNRDACTSEAASVRT